MNKESREAVTNILEQYLNHRLVAGLVDSISDRLADINSKDLTDKFASEAGKWKHLEKEIAKQMVSEYNDSFPMFPISMDALNGFYDWVEERK